MKQLHLARLVIVSTNRDRADALALELADWGLAKATVLSDQSVVAERLARDVDALILDNEDAPQNAPRNDMGLLLPPPALADSRAVSLLLLARPSRSAVRSAALLGYGAVIPKPASARVIYRRLGAMLQRNRRAARDETGLNTRSAAASRETV